MASSATKTKKSTAKTANRGPKAPIAPKGSWENPLIPHAKYQQLYATMLRAQLLERTLGAKLAPEQRSPEALTALILDLRAEDTLASTAVAHRFVKGAPLKQLLAKKKSKEPDHGFAAASILPEIADTAVAVNAALGIAFTYKATAELRNSNVVVAFTADEVACLAALKLAEEHRLPILFVYPQRTTTSALSMKARRFGIPGMPVDRDDAVAVYRVAQEAIARARSGGGPTLIECMRYTVPQRPQSAIATLERNLTGKGLFTRRWKSALIADFRREIARAARAARKTAKR